MSKLKGYRVMLGLTQQAMADKLNISLQSYNNKETKKTPFNDKERLAIKSMVAEIKPDVTIDELFYQDQKGKQANPIHTGGRITNESSLFRRCKRAVYDKRDYR